MSSASPPPTTPPSTGSPRSPGNSPTRSSSPPPSSTASPPCAPPSATGGPPKPTPVEQPRRCKPRYTKCEPAPEPNNRGHQGGAPRPPFLIPPPCHTAGAEAVRDRGPASRDRAAEPAVVTHGRS